MTCSCAVGTVARALPTYIVKSYTNVDLKADHKFEEYSYIHGYYEIKKDGHEARSASHVSAGQTKMDAYSQIRYLDTNSKIKLCGGSDNGGVVSGKNGWIESRWLSLPKGTYSSVLGIQFCEKVYDDKGRACYLDAVNVNW